MTGTPAPIDREQSLIVRSSIVKAYATEIQLKPVFSAQQRLASTAQPPTQLSPQTLVFLFSCLSGPSSSLVIVLSV